MTTINSIQHSNVSKTSHITNVKKSDNNVYAQNPITNSANTDITARISDVKNNIQKDFKDGILIKAEEDKENGVKTGYYMDYNKGNETGDGSELTMGKICARYGLSIRELAQENGLATDVKNARYDYRNYTPYELGIENFIKIPDKSIQRYSNK